MDESLSQPSRSLRVLARWCVCNAWQDMSTATGASDRGGALLQKAALRVFEALFLSGGGGSDQRQQNGSTLGPPTQVGRGTRFSVTRFLADNGFLGLPLAASFDVCRFVQFLLTRVSSYHWTSGSNVMSWWQMFCWPFFRKIIIGMCCIIVYLL